MPGGIESQWIVYGVVAVLALLVAWWLLRRGGKGARVREYQPDVLDEGVGPAQRNQALIDSAPAAAVVLPPTVSDALGGAGEVVAAAAQDEVEEQAAEIAPEPEPEAPSTGAGADDLSRIKGLGPKLQALLPELGITTFAQIAALTEADLADLDTKLGPFAGRPARDGWVEQARYLAAGDVAGFEARFGKV
ncbi:MAG: hypothetical protein U1E37_09170 [Sphingomonadaceae bacterium]